MSKPIIKRTIQAILRTTGVRENVFLGADFHIGPGSVVWAPRRLDIGSDVYIGKNATIEVDGVIGDHVLIANTVGIIGKSDHAIDEIGTSVRRSSWVGDHPTRLSTGVVIGSDVWIGYGAVVLSGITIGDSCVIAAGAVVTTDIPSNSIAAGIPARVIKSRFKEEDFRTHWQVLSSKGIRPIAK